MDEWIGTVDVCVCFASGIDESKGTMVTDSAWCQSMLWLVSS